MKNFTKQQFIRDLSRLVSFQTLTSDTDQNSKALDFIETKISKKAIVKRISNNNRELLIASNIDIKKPDICFLVHVDVVAARSDQFNMTIKNGVAFGRGVSDMKFSIPMGYALLNEVIEKKTELSFSLVITTDEETGGFEGAAYLANEYGLEPKALIVPDGGDNFVYINKSKGVCALRIDSKGTPAHSSRIWEGKNALEPIIELCRKVLERYSENNKKETWGTTVNIGKLQGGISANQVCPEAFAILDFRFPETSSFEKIFNEVRELANVIDPSLKISTHSIGSPTSVDTNNPIVTKFLKNMESALGKTIAIMGAYGASDARHFAPQNVPILMIKPIGGDIHGDNENINIDSCMKFYKGLQSFIEEMSSDTSIWHR